jgi:malate synthase
MTAMIERAGLKIDSALAQFIDQDVLAPLNIAADAFWSGFAALLADFAPRNRALLALRDELQAKIDAWHMARAGKPIDSAEYEAFLREIGYLVPEPGDFTVTTQNVDREIALMAGPQLVVPVLNARFLLNAANARWGSLYDALYGTDALDAPPARPGGYDEQRGAAVIAAARAFLDSAVPLAGMSWAEWDGAGDPPLADPAALIGHRAEGAGLILEHNGLVIEIVIDRDHPVGKDRQGRHCRRGARSRAHHHRRSGGFGCGGRCRGQARGLPQLARRDPRRSCRYLREGRRDAHPHARAEPGLCFAERRRSIRCRAAACCSCAMSAT